MPGELSTNQDLSSKCVSVCSNPGSKKGAWLLRPTQMAPQAHNGVSLRQFAWTLSLAQVKEKYLWHIFYTRVSQRKVDIEGRLDLLASKLNFCGFLYLEVVRLVLNLKEFFFFSCVGFSVLCSWICKAAATALCMLQFSLWRNCDLSVSYMSPRMLMHIDSNGKYRYFT